MKWSPGIELILEAVAAFAAGAGIIIAHNANFDRKFADAIGLRSSRRHGHARQRRWNGASMDLTDRGWGYPPASVGLFHQAHRAVDDCHALVEILASDLPGRNRSALAVLLGRARRKTMRIWAEHSPFNLKDELKKRGAIAGVMALMADQGLGAWTLTKRTRRPKSSS